MLDCSLKVFKSFDSQIASEFGLLTYESSTPVDYGSKTATGLALPAYRTFQILNNILR